MYTPKNILLTGGAGFIGSHVVATLAMHAEYKARLQGSASDLQRSPLLSGGGARQAGLLLQHAQPGKHRTPAEREGEALMQRSSALL